VDFNVQSMHHKTEWKHLRILVTRSRSVPDLISFLKGFQGLTNSKTEGLSKICIDSNTLTKVMIEFRYAIKIILQKKIGIH